LKIKDHADVIFLNGNVITANESNETAQAVAVKDNVIVYCGEENGARELAGKDTEIIDAEGRTIMPGFTDSHIHFCSLGLKKGPIIDINYENVRSVKGITEMIRKAAARKKPGEWIVLSGYDHNKLDEKRHPSIEELDEAAPDNPVRCIRCCAHMGVYNSAALKIGGISDPLEYGEGEVVSENGKLTGLLKENAHMYMGSFVKFTEEELKEGIRLADEDMARYGITSVCDAGGDGVDAWPVMRKMADSGEINTRIRCMIFDLAGKEGNKKAIDDFLSGGYETFGESNSFGARAVKIMIDGSSSGPSSATRQPYSHDKDLKGILVWEQDEIDEVVEKVHNAGFQMTAHAVGDKAVEMILNAIEKAQRAHPREGARHRIEHCGIVDEELIERLKRLEMIPVANPGFIERNGKDYNRFYGERVDYMFPLRRFLDKGIVTAIGSDAPVVPENPMNGLYGALTRKDGFTGEAVGECQKISLLEAVKMYTYNGAYACFDEKSRGSIEEGKLADIIMLSEDIMKIPAEDIRNVEPVLTMTDGKIVYRKL